MSSCVSTLYKDVAGSTFRISPRSKIFYYPQMRISRIFVEKKEGKDLAEYRNEDEEKEREY